MPEFKISESRSELIEQMIIQLPDIRKKMRITQTELAQVVGKSRQTISDIERKASPMGWDTFLAIIKMLESNGAFDGCFSEEYRQKLENEIKIAH